MKAVNSDLVKNASLEVFEKENSTRMKQKTEIIDKTTIDK